MGRRRCPATSACLLASRPRWQAAYRWLTHSVTHSSGAGGVATRSGTEQARLKAALAELEAAEDAAAVTRPTAAAAPRAVEAALADLEAAAQLRQPAQVASSEILPGAAAADVLSVMRGGGGEASDPRLAQLRSTQATQGQAVAALQAENAALRAEVAELGQQLTAERQRGLDQGATLQRALTAQTERLGRLQEEWAAQLGASGAENKAMTEAVCVLLCVRG
jgi:hypothetical protein